MFGDGFMQDVHIWLNKAPVQNPLLCEEDGPVYQLRRWYEQFYVDQADVTPEMTERFEFEVDTTKANEYWHAEVAENLAKKAAEDATAEDARGRRPDRRRRGLMVSFAPTSEETLEDQRLYTQARLTEVACLDCLATVGVKKNSEHHTSIQWHADSLEQCAEFRKMASRAGRAARLRDLLAAALLDRAGGGRGRDRDRGPGWLLSPSCCWSSTSSRRPPTRTRSSSRCPTSCRSSSPTRPGSS